MKRTFALVLVLAVVLMATPALAQDTLEKIKTSGQLVIGTRTGSPPFAYVNKDNQWVGFSIDLVEMLIKPEVEKAVGKSIKIEKKESTPPTRIPLLSSNAVDLIAGEPMGRPKSAAFRTADMVGLDTFAHVADNCYAALESDEDRDVFKVPAFIRTM